MAGKSPSPKTPSRIELEVALRSAERRLTTLVDSALDAVITMDASGEILTWNPQAVRVFGWELEEVTGRALADTIIPPSHREAHRSGLHHFLATGEGPILNRRIEVTALDRSGREFPVELTVTPVRLGEEWTFSAFIRDLSERRLLEDQLRQSQKMEAVGQLAGGVAHDFNNLLTAILGTTDLALMDMRPGDPHQEDFEAIRHAARRAASLTHQLLAFSRKQVLQPRHIDLNAVVRSAEGLLHRLIGENIELVIELAPRLHAVRADPAQLEQVILNLAVNARDAMPGGGRLEIRTKNLEGPPSSGQAEWVQVTVTDNGMGIDEVTKGRIFEPFFTTKGLGKGTGLGLSMVYGIVRQSAGSIVVESEPGKGASFIVRLPADHTPAEPLPTLHGGGTIHAGGETILVVEDEPALRSVVRRILEREGYRVVEARDAEMAIRLVDEMAGEFGLILTDVVMPGQSGPELAEQIRGRYPELRVMFMTGYFDEASREGRLVPDTPCLQKPFSPDALLATLRKALDAPLRAPDAG